MHNNNSLPQGIAEDVSNIMADSNKQIQSSISHHRNDLNALNKIAQVQRVAQGEAAAALKEGIKNWDLTDAKDNFSGSNLNSAIKDATDDIGQVSVNDDTSSYTPPSTHHDHHSEPTFFVHLSNNIIEFSGTATGEIKLSLNNDRVSFSRDGVTASRTMHFDEIKEINLTDGQSLDAQALKICSIGKTEFYLDNLGETLEAPVEHDGKAYIYVHESQHNIDLGDESNADTHTPAQGYADYVEGANHDFVFL